MAQLDKEKAEMELQMKRLKHELQTAQLEMNKSAGKYKEAQNQIEMLSKEKGKKKDSHTLIPIKMSIFHAGAECDLPYEIFTALSQLSLVCLFL